MREGRMSLIRTGKALIPEKKHYGSHQKIFMGLIIIGVAVVHN